jgi:hypothetical protein
MGHATRTGYLASIVAPASPKDVVLALLSSALLLAMVLAGQLPWTGRLHPLLTFLLLILGSWRGLVVVGYVADAVSNPMDDIARRRILDDRFIGSFGVSAIALSVLTQLAAVLSIGSPTIALAVSPIAAATLGLFGGMVVASRRARLPRVVGVIGVLAVAIAITAMSQSSIPAVIAAALALLTAWRLSADRRHDLPVGPVAAGHVALLTLLTLGQV